MLDTDQQILLARRISRELSEVSRNEWMRWLQIFERSGLDGALGYANAAANDFSLRPRIRRAYRLIGQAIQGNKSQLRKLSAMEKRRVFGYVGWLLRIGTLHGALR